MLEKIQQLNGIWGWRGIIGQISPSVFSLLGEYFYQVVPQGIGLMAVTLGIDEPSSEEEVEQALSKVEDAALKLARGGAHFICMSGEPLVLSKGHSWEKQIIKRIEEITKIPTTTSITAVIEALNALSVKKLVMASPSSAILKERSRSFLEARGFKVLNIKGPEIVRNSEIRKLPFSLPYNVAKEAYLNAPEADGIYIPCGAWGGHAVINFLEQDLGKPVVTSHQAFIWSGLKALHIREPIKGFGRLFEML